MTEDKNAEILRLRKICGEYERDAELFLAPVLGYPLYLPGSPGYNKDRDNYDVGDHCAASLIMEAAKVIRELR